MHGIRELIKFITVKSNNQRAAGNNIEAEMLDKFFYDSISVILSVLWDRQIMKTFSFSVCLRQSEGKISFMLWQEIIFRVEFFETSFHARGKKYKWICVKDKNKHSNIYSKRYCCWCCSRETFLDRDFVLFRCLFS